MNDRRGTPIGNPTSRGAAVRSSRVGRVCTSPGCATVLSIYNGDAYCWAHQPAFAPRPGQVLRG